MGLFSNFQEFLPFILPIYIIVVLYLIEKYIYKPVYIPCILTLLIISFGFVFEFLHFGNIRIPYVAYLHLLSVPISFLFYYAVKERFLFPMSFSILLLGAIFILNYKFRTEIIDLYLYGRPSTLLSKDIRINSIAVITKGNIDTALTFSDKAYIIDIWGVYCPVCYSDMTLLDSVKKSDSNFRLVSLLAYSKLDSAKSIKKIGELSNCYSSYLLKDTALLRRLEIDKFPNYLILFKNKIVFRNSLENVLDKYYKLN